MPESFISRGFAARCRVFSRVLVAKCGSCAGVWSLWVVQRRVGNAFSPQGMPESFFGEKDTNQFFLQNGLIGDHAAFDQNQGLSEPFDALLWVLDGTAKVSIAKEVFLVNAGEWILLPAKKPHAVNAKTRFKMLLTMTWSE